MRKGIFLAFFILIRITVSAQTGPFPSLEADPRAGEYGRSGRDGTYSWRELGAIALWASSVEAPGAGPAGGEGRNTASFEELLWEAAADLRASPLLPEQPRERGEYILTFIHERFLRSYSEYQTRVDEIFTTGRYNCVSSAVLYAVLALSCGLDVQGVMTRDHAFVTVDTGSELIDVETTNPYGFDPGSRREFHDGFGRLTGFAYVPVRNYRDRTAISRLELISLILSNRIFEMESRGRYHEAVPLAVHRAALLAGRRDPVSSPFFPEPQKDLMDRLFNYGAALVKAGQEQDALLWADTAGRRYPDEGRWREFNAAAVNNLLVKLLRSRRIGDARNELLLNAARLNPGDFDRLDAVVLDAELVQRVGRLETADEVHLALESLAAAAGRSVLPESRIAELRTAVFLKEGERLAAERGFPEAIAYTEEAIANYGNSPSLQNALRVFRANQVAILHNTFADLYNQGDYEGARRIIRTALEEFPNDRRLTADFNLVNQALRP
jgi:tetratricopeptide (TPR) repeat protein